MFDIEGSLRVVAAMVCKLIYKLIALIYELFMTIARVNILSSEEIAPIYQRVTMILTIVMVFYITFEFVKYVVQPDTINDKEKGAGNVALKMIVVILLIAFVPRIFTMAYDLQGRIIDNQAISKIILGNTNIDSNMGTYGRAFAADVLSVFYKVNEEVCNGCEEGNIVNYNLNRLVENGDLKYLTTNLKEYEKVKNPVTNKNEDIPIIDFDGGLAIIVGALIIYILVLYCIDVGTRYAQLIFLQVISPVAIMGYLTPKKDNMFTKWLKQCTTTYIDLFIRIAIIYFVLLICQVLGDAYGSGKLFEGLGEISAGLKMFTYIALILGLLLFANKAPKMLQELFPSSGAAGIGYGLGAKSRFEPAMKAVGGARRVAGGAAGFVAGGIAGRSLRAALAGAKSGASKDRKGLFRGSAISRARAAIAAGGAVRQEDEDIRAAGGTPLGKEYMGDFYKNKAKEQDRRNKTFEDAVKSRDTLKTSINDLNQMKTIQTRIDAAVASGDNDLAERLNMGKKELEKKIVQAIDTGNYDEVNQILSNNNLKTIDSKDAKVSIIKNNIENYKKSGEEANKAAQGLKDKDGKEIKIYDENLSIHEQLGDIEDNSKLASQVLKDSEEYTRAHANSSGSGKN